MINKVGRIQKGWGYEDIFASTESYCGKFLVFDREFAECSMHFHRDKLETWFIEAGEFDVEYINTQTTETHTVRLRQGSTWTNHALVPHRIICVSPGRILEVSTADHMEDNYKIAPGDSQNG